MQQSRYAEKIARIKAGTYRRGDFIIADAKDCDLSGGVSILGPRRDGSGRLRRRAEFLDEICALIRQDIVDIMLASTASIEVLHETGAFEGSRVMPAFRANDATDVWTHIRGGEYRKTPSLPFRGTELEFARAELCLYSLTFNNDAYADLQSLESYKAFRRDARAAGKKHFLEVFNPNTNLGFDATATGAYVNDCILRLLASMTRSERPEFLKVAYNGPAAVEELAGHDASLVIGVLGGGQGTHRDCFELVRQAEAYGARLALFGRKINNAEHQASFVTWLRAVADGTVSPVEAVKAYHGDLARLGLAPDRAIDADLQITEEVLRSAL